MAPAATIAAYTLKEALRNRLLWVLGVLAAGAVGVAGFLGELALTDSAALQVALLAAVLRLSCVFLVAAFVVTSMVREANDKGLDLLLALPYPRATYVAGKLLGFCALALLPATLFGLLALLLAPPLQCLLWSVSLLCELWLVAAFGLLCVLTLTQVVPALAATFGFYLLARALGGLQLLGHAQEQAASSGQRLLGNAIDALAFVLPRLDTFTRTEWLVYHDGKAADLGALLAQTALYLALLGAAALFDLYRKEL